jgi:hypothetical protein
MHDDLDHVSFAEWLIELNACAVKAGYKGQPLVRITGQLCWYGDYESGIPPEKALKIVEKETKEFASDYQNILSNEINVLRVCAVLFCD